MPRSKGRGGLGLDECRTAYIRHLREQAAGRSDIGSERARLAKEQADGQAMKNAQLRGEMLPRDEVSAAVQAMISHAKARLIAIPTKAAPLVATLRSPNEIKAKLTEIINEALAELAATEVVAGNPRGSNGRRGK